MGKETKISWADHTGNPWVGCSVAHTGCHACYARDFSQKKHGKVRGPWALWGPGQDRLVTKGFWTDAPKWAKAARQDGVRRTLFASLMDPLDPEVYERDAAPDGVACRETFDQYMDVLDEVMPFGAGLPGLVPLILTKRPEYWDRIPQRVRAGSWLLYSASDQPSLDAGMPHLLAAEGFAGLGLSLEPLVGPVEAQTPREDYATWIKRIEALPPGSMMDSRMYLRGNDGSKRISWVIIGGESGRNARPCDVAWIRDLVRQCREAGVAPYVKQAGALAMGVGSDVAAVLTAQGATKAWKSSRAWRLPFRHPAGADPSEWPADVRVQEFPEGLR